MHYYSKLKTFFECVKTFWVALSDLFFRKYLNMLETTTTHWKQTHSLSLN